MTTWYNAVCDIHKQHCAIFVVRGMSESGAIAWPPTTEWKATQFLQRHWNCHLRLSRDDQDNIPDGYEQVDP